MSTVHIDILIMERVLYSGDVDHAVLPGAEGEMGVYAGHASVITLLKNGVVRVTETENADPLLFIINDGYASVGKKGIRVIARRAEAVHGMDKDKIGVERDRIKEKLIDLDPNDAQTEYVREELEWYNLLLEYNA